MTHRNMYTSLYWPRRRTSSVTPWNPADIADCVSWVRADAGIYQDLAPTTPATSNGDPVGYWVSTDTPSYPFYAAANANRPTLTTGWSNGQPALTFTGSPIYLKTDAWPALITQDMTLWVVFQDVTPPLSVQGVACIANTAQVATRGLLEVYLNTTGATLRGRASNAATTAVQVTTAGSNTKRAIALRRDSANNITLAATPASTSSNTGADLTTTGNTGQLLGCTPNISGFYQGAIAEVAIYSRELDDSEITTLNDYATTRYGL